MEVSQTLSTAPLPLPMHRRCARDSGSSIRCSFHSTLAGVPLVPGMRQPGWCRELRRGVEGVEDALLDPREGPAQPRLPRPFPPLDRPIQRVGPVHPNAASRPLQAGVADHVQLGHSVLGNAAASLPAAAPRWHPAPRMHSACRCDPFCRAVRRLGRSRRQR